MLVLELVAVLARALVTLWAMPLEIEWRESDERLALQSAQQFVLWLVGWLEVAKVYEWVMC